MMPAWKARLERIGWALVSRLDPELRQVRKLCDTVGDSDMGLEEAQAEDDPLVRRIRTFPAAFKMSFWKRHFEWNALGDYPEIRGRLLDFGCGSGHSDIYLARNGRRVHGVDISPFGIRVANLLRSKEPAEVRERVSFQLADVTRCAPAREPYDAVWASHVFEHIEDPGPVIGGLRKWARKDACMLISVPLGRAYDDPTHIHHFEDEAELRRLLDDHICILRVETRPEDRVIRAVCRF